MRYKSISELPILDLVQVRGFISGDPWLSQDDILLYVRLQHYELNTFIGEENHIL
jgi:hypothetical protein